MSNQALETLIAAQLLLAQELTRVSASVPAIVPKPEPATAKEPVSIPFRTPQKPRAKNENTAVLDSRVLELLRQKPGQKMRELVRKIVDGTVSRSRLEWSLRRLLASGRIERSGNTCRAKYSCTAPSSSLRQVK